MSETDTLASDLRVVLGQLVRRLRSERRDLSLIKASVLGRLDRSGPTTTSALAAAERVRPQSMATIVAALTDSGLVTRRDDPGDGRSTLIDLTPQGLDVILADRARKDDWLAQAMDKDLTAEERAVVARATELLGRLTDD
jgi:DNA-binding MarR family transcriptional regulator